MATLHQRLQDFDHRTRELFKGRPYWLVEEALVRAAFVDALLDQQTFDAKIHDARHICLEAERCKEKLIDLVARDLDVGEMAVEFKGWNIVSKYRPNEQRTIASNASKGLVADKFRLCCLDSEKLARVASQEPATQCLLVIYCQRALDWEHATRFAGRVRGGRLELTMDSWVDTPERFVDAACANVGNDGIRFSLEDLTPNLAPFSCASETEFILRVYRVRPKAPNRE